MNYVKVTEAKLNWKLNIDYNKAAGKSARSTKT